MKKYGFCLQSVYCYSKHLEELQKRQNSGILWAATRIQREGERQPGQPSQTDKPCKVVGKAENRQALCLNS